jgi:hypothetical protein
MHFNCGYAERRCEDIFGSERQHIFHNKICYNYHSQALYILNGII